MAKNRTNLDDDLDLDLSGFDDVDFDSGDDYGPSDNKRKPTLFNSLRRMAGEDIDMRRNDAKLRRELLKSSLPSDYTSSFEAYDTVSNEVGSIWREQEKQWEAHRPMLKKAVKPYAQVLGSLGFKRLEKWVDEPERSRSNETSQDEMDELKIQSILSETFGSYMDQQRSDNVAMETARQEKEDDRHVEEKAERQESAKRDISSNKYLQDINNNSSAIRSFNDAIVFPAVKKQLELQARLLLVNQRQLQIMTSFKEDTVRELTGIHKNTGLPDYLKIKPSEMIERGILGKVVQGATAPFDGVGKKIAKKVTAKVRSKLTDFWQFAGETLQGATDFGQEAEESGEGAVNRAGDFIGGSAIGWLGDKIQNKLTGVVTPKIRDYLEKNHKIKLAGSNLKALTSEASGMVNEGLQRGFGNNLLDSIVNMLDLGEAAERGNNLVYDSKQLDLEKAAFMDNRFKLSIVEVIPGWLKKIHAASYYTAYKKEAGDQTWDFKRSKFVDVKDQENALVDKIVTKDNVDKQVKAVNAWIDAFDEDGLFSRPTRDFVEKWLLEEKNKGYTLNPSRLIAANLKAPRNIKEELLITVPRLLNLSDKDIELLASGELSDIFMMGTRGNIAYNNKITKLADRSVDVRSANSLSLAEIQKAADDPESRNSLIKLGIIYEVADGQWVINPDFEHKAFNTRRRDYKRNARLREVDGEQEIEVIDSDYSNSENEIKNHRRLNAGTLHLTDREKEQILLNRRMAQNTRPAADKMSLGSDYITSALGLKFPTSSELGKDYIINALGQVVHSSEPGFTKTKNRKLPKDYKGGKLTPAQMRGLYAAGGTIESFAKGGTPNRRGKGSKGSFRPSGVQSAPKIEAGPISGEPDEAFPVITHGGEMVVNRDATKFNQKLLEAINKYGAPLINADGSVNSVYHKLFGFKSAKDFDIHGKVKGAASKLNSTADEQIELAIKNILAKLDITALDLSEAKKLTDPSIGPKRRLANCLAAYTKLEKNKAKANPKAYAKSLASNGVKALDGKIDKWLGDDETNKQIKQTLYMMAGNAGSKIKHAGLSGVDKMKRLQAVGKSNMLDRAATLTSVAGHLKTDIDKFNHDRPVDIYIESNPRSPILTARGFGTRLYYDQKTGEVIKSPAQVTGTVVDEKGRVKISTEDLMFEKFFIKDPKTGSPAPYKFIGMQETTRKFMTSTEYAKNRFNVISQTEQFKKGMESLKNARDKYVIDKPIDVCVRTDPATIVLYAAKFKARDYIDKQTGNPLWSHHDITGEVVDKDNNTVLSKEQLEAGLCDTKGTPLKISKLKAFRNNVFRRGDEVYKKHLSKHVNKLGGGLLNKISAMGEKTIGLNFDKKPIDVFVPGETTPRITAIQFKSKKVFDVNSKKVIKSHSGISGEVKLIGTGTMTTLLTADEVNAGLVDGMGDKIKLPLMMGALSRFKEYAIEAALPTKYFKRLKNFVNLSPEKRQQLKDENIAKLKIAYDVYIKGNPAKPVLTKKGFEAGEYISKKTQKVIVIPEYIDGPVMDSSGNILLTEEDIKTGLENFDGKPVKLFNPEAGLFGNIGVGKAVSARIAKAVGLRLKSKAKEEPVASSTFYTIMGANGEKLETITKEEIEAGQLSNVESRGKRTPIKRIEDIGNWFCIAKKKGGKNRFFLDFVFEPTPGIPTATSIVDDKGKEVYTQWHKANGKLPLGAKIGAAVSGKLGGLKARAINLRGKLASAREGSWQWLRDKAKLNKEEKKSKDDKPKEKKESWIGKLVKGFMSPMTLLFGGLFGVLSSKIGMVKAAFLTGLAWLGKSVIPKLLMGLMKGGGVGGMMGGGGRGKWGGRLGKGLAVGALAYGASQMLGSNDAEAHEADPNDPAGVGSPVDPEEQEGTGGGIASTLGDFAIPGAMMAASMMGGRDDRADVNPDGTPLTRRQRAARTARNAARRTRNGASRVGRIASRLRTPGLGVGNVGRAARGVGSVASSIAGSRLVSGAATTAGKIATGVGKFALGSARLTGAAMSLAPTLFRGALMLGRFALGPWGLALTAAYYLSKKGLQMWNDKKNPWNRYRLAQYGFDHNDSDIVEKIAKIEGMTIPMLKIGSDGSVGFKKDDKTFNEVLKICGVLDEEGKPIDEQKNRMSNVVIWFEQRFLRVFSSYLQWIKKITGKNEMIDLKTLDRDQQTQLFSHVGFTDMETSPYVVMASPFEEPSVLEIDFNAVDKIARKLKDAIAELPKPEKKATTAKGDDGLDGKLKPNANKTPEANAVDKKMNAESARSGKKDMTDPKTMTDAASKAVKYTAEANKAIAKTHQKEMIKTAQETTKQSESLFDKAVNGFMNKAKDYLSASKTAFNKVTSGTVGGVVDGVGDAIGATANAMGVGKMYDAGQMAMDSMTGAAGGKGEGVAVRNLLTKAMQAGITDPTELTMLLAQARQESNNFKTTREYGNDAYFAKYNNRKDLGNGPDDGAKYKGRGYIQLTGKANYAAFSKWAGQDFVSNPQLVEQEPWATAATIWFWTCHPNMTRRGRAAAQRGDVKGTTLGVNGGTNHLENRIKYFNEFKQLIGGDVNGYLAKLGGGAGGSKVDTSAGPTAAPAGAPAAGGTPPPLLAKPQPKLSDVSATPNINNMLKEGSTLAKDVGGKSNVVQPKVDATAVPAKDNKPTASKAAVPPLLAKPSTATKVASDTAKQNISNQATVLKDVNDNIKSKADFVKALNPAFIEAGKKAYKLQNNSVDISGMNPEFWTIFLAMIGEYKTLTNDTVQINSAYRSVQKQKAMYEAWIACGKKGACVAAPGRSRHNTGLAIDIQSEDANAMVTRGLFKKYRFHRPVPGEAWHCENLLFGNPNATNQAIAQDMNSTSTATNTVKPAAGGGSPSNTINNVSSGQGSLATSPFSNSSSSSPNNNMSSQDSNNTMVDIMTRQLSVQEKILNVLETIAGGSNSLKKESTGNDSPTQAGKSGIDTPNLDKALEQFSKGQPVDRPSPFAGIKNPISVSKPS